MNVKQSFLRLTGAAVLLATLLLAACSSIPLRSLWALRQFDWQQFEGDQLRLLAWMPPSLGARPDAALVQVKIARGNPAGDVLETTLVLRAVTPGAAGAPTSAGALPAPPSTPGRWLALALDEAEQRRLAALRAQAQAWRAADGPDARRQLSLTLTPQLCLQPGAGAAWAQTALSVWLRWRADQEDLLLLDRATPAQLDEALAKPPPAC